MKLTNHDVDMLEQWWIEKSRKNFLAYRMYLRHGIFKNGWFINDLAKVLQNFYAEYRKGSRPIYIINTPPQHGKSWSVMDFISWIIGLDPSLRIIFASYAERLGKRCNLALQRTMDINKYQKIFPDFKTSDGIKDKYQKNSELIEFYNKNDISFPGYFRNTTVEGSITGDTADIGIIDDPVKGRAEARSPVKSQSIWEWWEDDFTTRFDDNYGVLIIMTRWVTHDLTGRLIESNKNVKLFNYQAIAEQNEKYRKCGEALFPELKSQEFLEQRKKSSSKESWGSLYQGSPTVEGGNLIKDEWWKWWKVLPPIKYKFITADTAQKDKTQNDYSDFKCWGVGIDFNLYLLDHIRGKWKAPELRKEAEIFFRKHNIPKQKVDDPVLRGIYIEDKSSGSSLIQELRKKRIRVYEVQRNTDKYLRVDDASPYIEMGRVYLNIEINEIGNTLKEAREFPNSKFDDDLDSLITAIEIVYINKKAVSSLQAAMAA